MSTAPAPAPPRFAAWQTALSSYSLLFKNFGSFLRVCWAWVLLAYLVGYAGGYLAVHTSNEALAILGAVAVTLCAAAVAVKWHRRVMLGAAAVGPALALGRRDALFIGRALLLMLAVTVPTALLMFLVIAALFADDQGLIIATVILCFVLALISLYVLIRFSLIMPAAAIDAHDFGWRESWRATAGVSLPLWGGSLVAILPLAIASKLVENLAIFLVYQFQMLPLAIGLGFLSTLLVFVDVGLIVTYTSLAYRTLTARG